MSVGDLAGSDVTTKEGPRSRQATNYFARPRLYQPGTTLENSAGTASRPIVAIDCDDPIIRQCRQPGSPGRDWCETLVCFLHCPSAAERADGALHVGARVRVPSVASRSDRRPAAPAIAAERQTAGRRRPWKALTSYFRRLWQGDLPLSRVFWTDMLVIGTLVNVATLLVAVLLFSVDAPLVYGVVLFLVHIPYSIALFIGVWRSAAREKSRWSPPAQVAAVIWLIAALVI